MSDSLKPFNQSYYDGCLATLRLRLPLDDDSFDHAEVCARHAQIARDGSRTARDREFFAGLHDYHLAEHTVQAERRAPDYVAPAQYVQPHGLAFVPRSPVLTETT